ncbi:MAG TPA: hypothetical protein VLH40_01115 [Atribacteraceae bacterium]|nr:hypothetical protein [Atribacteraceae bacterium]
MRKTQRNYLIFLLGVAVLGMFLTGCTVEILPPEPRFGSVNICSDHSSVYGNVFLDGRYEGDLWPNECLYVDDLRIGRTYTVRVDTGWEVIVQDFYFDFSGQVVTIR